MKPESWGVVHGELEACCAEFFSHCGVVARCEGSLASNEPPASGVIAFIGFSGAKLSGSLALVLPQLLLEQTHPMRGKITGDPLAAFHDWAGEISNQILGQLKNRLLRHGIVLQLCTPMTMQGTELRGRVDPREGFARPRFRAAESTFDLHFDATAEPEVELSPLESTESNDAAEQGECLLF